MERSILSVVGEGERADEAATNRREQKPNQSLNKGLHLLALTHSKPTASLHPTNNTTQRKLYTTQSEDELFINNGNFAK